MGSIAKTFRTIRTSLAHIKEKEVPHWKEQGAKFKLIAGKAFNKTSPTPVHSELYFIERKSSKKQQINIEKDLYGESALYILEVSIKADEYNYDLKQILVAKDSSLCSFEMEAETTIYIFGGALSLRRNVISIEIL